MDNNDLISALVGALSNPGAKEGIMKAVSSLGDMNQGNQPQTPEISQNESPETDYEPPKPASNFNIGNLLNGDSIQMMSRVQNVMEKLNNTDDHRIGLLNSIRPYMHSKRAPHIDTAIRFIQIINFAQGFKGF